ncbi:phosphoglycerate kinase [Candidatus Woesearchaeota archaeon]|nr:MAG: phosphoglycerate kinase [Candidatus Woesearchaeota archaeon]
MKTLKDVELQGQRVLMRTGFDMPLDEAGNITDDVRIKDNIDSIHYALNNGCKQLILLAHMGRPDGKNVEKLRMDVVAKKLSELLKLPVKKLDECIDIDLPDDRIILLENLRFHKEEEKNDDAFARKLASYGDVYVDDAFSNLHRAHASIVGIPKYLPGCIGFLVEKELKNLDFTHAERPFVCIMGGSKISTKFGLIKELVNKVDHMILGGAMIFTFYKAKGWEIGKSLHEDDFIMNAKMLLNNEKIILPEDIVVASEIKPDAIIKTVPASAIPADMIGLDIGPDSVHNFKVILENAKTIFWNGPMGYFEIPAFAEGTKKLAEYLANSGKKVIAGGGDTEAAIEGFKEKFFHVSSGGGASLELLEGKKLPGIAVLEENEKLFF